jgi:hypothetical protein
MIFCCPVCWLSQTGSEDVLTVKAYVLICAHSHALVSKDKSVLTAIVIAPAQFVMWVENLSKATPASIYRNALVLLAGAEACAAMPISSADFPVGIGGESHDVFGGQAPDDMQDVPLAQSVASTSMQSSAVPQARAAAPVSTSPHLHFPPTFKTPIKACGLTVRVHTPETVAQTTMGIPITHTVYQVETKSTLSSFPKAQCAVKRRFSDFDALYIALRNRYPGYFIPILPDKTILQGKLLSDKAFLEKRTHDLELFANECCHHEVVQNSTVRASVWLLPCATYSTLCC